MKKNPSLFRKLSWLVMLSLLLAACGPTAPQPTTVNPTEPPVKATATEAPITETPSLPDVEPPKVQRPSSGLSADPQRVEFQVEDGKNLVGYYYPSAYANSPVVILMHWAGGDLSDWCEIAPWLQNRQGENPVKPERCANAGAGLPAGIALTWLDPSWFPAMSAEVSVAVFAFDFRDFGESEKGGGGPDWARDAKAAFVTAAGLEGIDPTRMASIGASIGADGAADGCLLYFEETGGGCLGAFSLSPGGYLVMDYAVTVTGLAPNPAWCLTAELDETSAITCNTAGGENYRLVVYPGTDLHGMRLIAPELEPQPLILIQEFLKRVFGEGMG